MNIEIKKRRKVGRTWPQKKVQNESNTMQKSGDARCFNNRRAAYTIVPSYTAMAAPSVARHDLHGSLKADAHIACRAHAIPLLCHAATGLECVFPI